MLTVKWLCSRIEQVRSRSLFISGTADRFYQPEILKHLEDVAQGHSLVIQGADHGLEIPGSIPQSLGALHQIVGVIQEFLIEAASRV